jgi:hypothetical protein
MVPSRGINTVSTATVTVLGLLLAEPSQACFWGASMAREVHCISITSLEGIAQVSSVKPAA